MNKKILFVYPIDVQLSDYVHLKNFKYHYSPATYWEPEDEDIDYDLYVEPQFYDSILSIPVYVDEEDGEIRFYEHEGIKYHNLNDNDYIKFFKEKGYQPFWFGPLEDLANEDQAEDKIEAYLEQTVNELVEHTIYTYY